jgi:ubiquinone/menaquinone biosynthesis C-methylase UbiE
MNTESFKLAVIAKWHNETSADWSYFDSVEDKTDAFWSETSIFRKLFAELDLTSVVEIACGKGRHSERIKHQCQKLVLTDASPSAISFASTRFANYPNISCWVSPDGESLPFIKDASATAVFSYDAMVHFEPITVFSYLKEIHRILAIGGRALLHHSNYSEAPENEFNKSPGWRNYMHKSLFRHFASRAGLNVLTQTEFDWSVPNSDCLTLMEKV